MAETQHVGRFRPLSWPLTDLQERRLRLLADGVDEGMELVLPARDFWVLIRDPDDEYSDAQASWGLPALGEPFLLLCRPQHLPQIRTLHELELLTWRDEPLKSDMAGGPGTNTTAARCLRPRWDHVVPSRESRVLVESLRPRTSRLAVSLEGGLSIPGQNVWLEGYPPKMRIRAAANTFAYTVRRRSDGGIVCQDLTGRTHELTDLPALPPSEYEIDVRAGEGVAGRRGCCASAAWDDLQAAQEVRSRGRGRRCTAFHAAGPRICCPANLEERGVGLMQDWYVGRQANFHQQWHESYRHLLRTIDSCADWSVARVIRYSKPISTQK